MTAPVSGKTKDWFVVLTLDDDPTMQALYTIAFRKLPVHLQMAENEAQAQRFLENEVPDLLLADFWLGEENGLEVAEKLVAPTHKTIPILAVTAETSDLLRNYVESGRCLGYLLKPISLATFGEEALNYLNIQGSSLKQAANPRAGCDRQFDRKGDLASMFLQKALAKTGTLSLRSNSELLKDTALVQAAHQWVGASGISRLPIVEAEARELERLARDRRVEDLPTMRHLLSVIQAKFEGAASLLGSEYN